MKIHRIYEQKTESEQNGKITSERGKFKIKFTNIFYFLNFLRKKHVATPRY